jgi:hypothetical protein
MRLGRSMNLANIVPATLGEDGDPLDILVLMMLHSYQMRDGRSARSPAKQSEDWQRNDRLIVVAAHAQTHHPFQKQAIAALASTNGPQAAASFPIFGAPAWGGSEGKAPPRRWFFRVSGGTMKRQRRGPKWSAEVTETSDALDLEKDVFKSRSAKRIAESLKRSAEQSHQRKASPFHSAMSMLTFYINRAGKNLSASQKRILETAKTELRRQFDRAPSD